MPSLKAKLGEGEGNRKEKKKKQSVDTVMDAQGYIASIFKTQEAEAEIGPP